MNKLLFISIFLFNLFLLGLSADEKIDLTNKNTEIKILDTKINSLSSKTKKDYKKEENLLIPVEKEIKKTKKEDKLKIDTNVDFNKDTKSIDGVKVNVGTKF